MISLKELNPKGYPTTDKIDGNLLELQRRLNIIREAYGKPFKITSGLRSAEQQRALIAAGNSNAPKSKHLIGAAADVFDPQGELKVWLMQHLGLLEQVGLWLEDLSATPTWVHFQILPPVSGKRIFKP